MGVQHVPKVITVRADDAFGAQSCAHHLSLGLAKDPGVVNDYGTVGRDSAIRSVTVRFCYPRDPGGAPNRKSLRPFLVRIEAQLAFEGGIGHVA